MELVDCHELISDSVKFILANCTALTKLTMLGTAGLGGKLPELKRLYPDLIIEMS